MQSPCIGCEREHLDKSKCSLDCERRLEYFTIRELAWMPPPPVIKLKRQGTTDMNEPTDKPKRTCETEGCEKEAFPSGLCARCMGKRGAEANARKRADEKAKKSPGRPPGSKTGQDKGMVVSVDFGGYEEVLEQVKKKAQEEVRTLNGQVVYLLKKAMEEVISTRS